MNFRLLSLAAVPAALLGPCAPSGCTPPLESILDLEFSCVYDDGVTVFTIENLTGTGRFYVAYDRDGGWPLGTPGGDYEFYVGPYETEAIELTSEFDIDLVTIAPPTPAPGEQGYYAYDNDVAGSEDCGTGD